MTVPYSDTDTNIGMETVETARAADCAWSITMSSIADPGLFSKILNELYNQFQKGHTTEKTDQVSAQLALQKPKQESAETPATTWGTANTAEQSFRLTVEPTANMRAECSVTLSINSDLLKLQPNLGSDYVVVVALVLRSDPVPLNSKTYTVRWQRERDHIRFLKRRGEARRKPKRAVKLTAQPAQHQ